MLKLGPNKYMVEHSSELPEIREKQVFADFETTSFDDKKKAFDPYLGDRILGIAITAKDQSFYVPLRHRSSKNVDLKQSLAWFQGILNFSEEWINHNVKFDKHFAAVDNVTTNTRLVDTSLMAKMLNSDRMTHALKPICRDWLSMPMEEATRVDAYLKSKKSQDYAVVPADIMGEYATEDTVAARELYRYCREKLPDEQMSLWEKEINLTSVLWKMENRGFKADKLACIKGSMDAINKMIAASERIYELTGIGIVNSSDCMYEILCVQLGLPVLMRNKRREEQEDDEESDGSPGSPSFRKEAMKLYAGLPQVLLDPKKKEILDLISVYKAETSFNGLYCETFLELMDENGRIHPNYNQIIRTGRMSCSHPNGQNLNKRAKGLVVPEIGNSFACEDASQIEFRVIAHYCNIVEAIESYKTNAKTDYHQWVSDLCEIQRQAGKTMNFLMAFGGGRKKALQQLAYDPDIMRSIKEKSSSPEEYAELTARHASHIYDTYHGRLPEIKETSEYARLLCEKRGFIRNAYGRRRHLSKDFSYRAFNALIQGCAMDIIKERMVAIDPWLESQGVYQILNVHDELLQEGPSQVIEDPAFMAELKRQLEAVEMEFKVPFIWETKTSSLNWKEAKP